MPARPWSLLLLPLLALAGWLLLRPGAAPEEEPPEIAERPAPGTGAGPVLEAAQVRPTGAANLKDVQPATSAPSRTTGVRVFGRVTLGEPSSASGGQVALVDPAGPKARVLAQQALKDGLGFDWSLPFGCESATWDLRVMLCVPGRPRSTTQIALQRGDERQVDLALDAPDPNAPRIVGRLTDHRGRALADFPLALEHGAQRTMTGVGLPTGTDDLLTWKESQDPILVVSGPNGEFEALASQGAALWPLSLDPAWVVRAVPGGHLSPGKGPYRLEARPAARVRGRVRDTATGKPMTEYERVFVVRVGGDVRSTHSWVGSSDAEFDWAAASAGKGIDDLEIEVLVIARLYEPYSIRLRPTASGMAQELDIALRPLTPAEIGDLVVVSGLRDDRGQPLATQLTYVREQVGTTSKEGYPAEPALASDLGSVFRLAAGRHKAEIRLAGVHGRFLRWSGEVNVGGGGRTVFHVPWEAHGSLRVRLQAAQDGTWGMERLGLRPATGSSEVNVIAQPAEREVRIPALPVGTWVLTQRTKQGPTEQRFEISEGRETVLDIAR